MTGTEMSEKHDRRYSFLMESGYHYDGSLTHYVVKAFGHAEVSVMRMGKGYKVEISFWFNDNKAHPHADIGLKHNYTRKQLLADLPAIERAAASFSRWCSRTLTPIVKDGVK